MGAHPGGVPGHGTLQGEDEHTGGFEFVGHDNGAFDELLAWGGEFGGRLVIGATAFFDAGGDAVKDFDAFEGIFANGRMGRPLRSLR